MNGEELVNEKMLEDRAVTEKKQMRTLKEKFINLTNTLTIFEFALVSYLASYIFSKIIVNLGLGYKLIETMSYDFSFYVLIISIWILNFIKYSKSGSLKYYMLYFSILSYYLYYSLNIEFTVLKYFLGVIIVYLVSINFKKILKNLSTVCFCFVFLLLLLAGIIWSITSEWIKEIFQKKINNSKKCYSHSIISFFKQLKSSTIQLLNRVAFVLFLTLTALFVFIGRDVALFFNLISTASIIMVFYMILNLSVVQNGISGEVISAIGSFTIFWGILEYKDKKIKERIDSINEGLKNSIDEQKINQILKKIIIECYVEYTDYYELDSNLVEIFKEEPLTNIWTSFKELLNNTPKVTFTGKESFHVHVINNLNFENRMLHPIFLQAITLSSKKDVNKVNHKELLFGIIIYGLEIFFEFLWLATSYKRQSNIFKGDQIQFLKDLFNVIFFGYFELIILNMLKSPHKSADGVEFLDLVTDEEITSKLKKNEK